MIDPVLLAVPPAALIGVVWGVTSRIKRGDYVPPLRARTPARRALEPAVAGEVIHTVTAEVVRPPALAAAAAPASPGRRELPPGGSL